MQTFSVQIYKAGKDHCVDVPEHVIAGFRRSGHIPVRGRINDRVEFRAALVPSGGGHYRLFINDAMLQTIAAGTGDRVIIALKLDTEQKGL